MTRGVLLLCALAGCQDVLGLKPVAGGDGSCDSLSGHDEDGDCVVDTLDTCPGIANPDPADTDGDGIGDLCDPQPGKRDQLLKFYAFDKADDLTHFQPLGGNWFIQDDALTNDEHTSDQEDHLLEAMPRDLPIAIEAGVTVDMIDPTPPSGIAFVIGIEYVASGDTSEYSCNIRRTLDGSGNVDDQVESYAPGGSKRGPLSNSMLRAGAEYQLREILTATSLSCEVKGLAHDGGAISEGVTGPGMPQSIGLYTQDAVVHYNYLAIYALGS